MKVARLPALYAPAAFTPPGEIPGTHICKRLNRPQWKISITPSGI